MIGYHLVIFGGHWSSASGNITYLICYTTLQARIIEGSCNFVRESSTLYVTTLLYLVGIGIVVVEMFLICHVVVSYYLMK